VSRLKQPGLDVGPDWSMPSRIERSAILATPVVARPLNRVMIEGGRDARVLPLRSVQELNDGDRFG
jgi:hypothetical protein